MVDSALRTENRWFSYSYGRSHLLRLEKEQNYYVGSVHFIFERTVVKEVTSGPRQVPGIN